MNLQHRKRELQDAISAIACPRSTTRIGEADAEDAVAHIRAMADAFNTWANDVFRDVKDASVCSLGSTSFGFGIVELIEDDLIDAVRAAGEAARTDREAA